MRKILLILSLPLSLKAQTSVERPLRLHLHGVYSVPLESSVTNDPFIVDELIEGGGVSLAISYPLRNNLDIGLSFSSVNYKLDIYDEVEQLIQEYHTNTYATDLPTQEVFQDVDFHRFGFELSRVFKVNFIEVEPLVRAGGIWSSFNRHIVRIQQYNLEERDLEFVKFRQMGNATNITPYAGIGLRLNRWLFHKTVNLSVGGFYLGTGNMKFDFSAERVDFYNNTNRLGEINIGKRFDFFQLEIGMQMRLWKGMRADRDNTVEAKQNY